MVLIVGVAHLALYLLLTSEARAGAHALLARWGAAELAGARRPDAAPAPDAPGYAMWRRAHAVWVDAELLAQHQRQVWLLRTGLLASFLVQVGLTGWILARLLQRHRRVAARPARG